MPYSILRSKNIKDYCLIQFIAKVHCIIGYCTNIVKTPPLGMGKNRASQNLQQIFNAEACHCNSRK